MTGNAINAKSEALELRDLDAVSGGWFRLIFPVPKEETGGGQNGQNDNAQMFAQIMQQMTGQY